MHPNPSRRQFVWLIGLALMAALLTPPSLFPAPFPAGAGYYFWPVKLIVVTISFLGWVRLCAWVDLDAHTYRIDGIFWNGMLLLGGIVGFLLILGLGSFWISTLLFWIFVCAPAYWYLTKRNPRA